MDIKLRQLTDRFGHFILVDLEFLCVEGFGTLFENAAANKRPYALDEFPEQLELLSVNYVPVAIVGYEPGHYVTYTRQTSTRWDLLDDIVENITNCQGNEVVSPSLLVYFKM